MKWTRRRLRLVDGCEAEPDGRSPQQVEVERVVKVVQEVTFTQRQSKLRVLHSPDDVQVGGVGHAKDALGDHGIGDELVVQRLQDVAVLLQTTAR